ncbi:MAG: VOC family protein [Desulfobacteraceae bacterium]|nr:VOC family protein [Desulfobacteraceae bacterium]
MSLLHIGISVLDLDRAVNWYCRNFGFAEQKRFKKQGFEISGAVLTNKNNTLELLEPFYPVQENHKDVKDLTSLLRRTGLNHIAIQVDDLKKTYNTLQEQDTLLITDIISDRFFFCLDPDGTPLEVKQK